MEQSTVCPWCQTEITWDEETGPENVCPYCENELGDYRTISVEIERDDDYAEDEGDAESKARAEGAGVRGRFPDNLDMDSFRPVNLRLIALEGKLEKILNEQLEVPECPSCREYMIEAGTQTVGAILPAPFRLVWYVCPNCHHAHSRLAPEDRERLLANLEDED